MELDAFDRTLRGLVRGSPFYPFTVEMNTGRMLEVTHPEAMVFNRGVAVYIDTNGIPNIFDHAGVTRFIGATGAKPAESA